MSSNSSSDSDSDDFEPIRKIKINIRPKEDVVRRGAADVSEIRASVEAWRPLGPPPHPSLSRRQSSLSSVSSMSFGMGSVYGSSSGTTTSVSATNNMATNQPMSSNLGMLSSPSCSSLVNEFSNRASFTNLLSMTSRNASPLAPLGQTDIVPIAIAIQESIELIIKGNYEQQNTEPLFSTRAMGNIKLAFPNTFARSFSKGKNNSDLKFKLHPIDKITRYLVSRFIKDTEINSEPVANGSSEAKSTVNGESEKNLTTSSAIDLLDLDTTLNKPMQTNEKVFYFDMKELSDHLKKAYDQSPMSKYYNVDVLRYQISPVTSVDESPLQVCAYWKLESRCVKIRIYFKHSDKSDLKLDRFRDITFTVELSNLIPDGIDIDNVSLASNSSMRPNLIDPTTNINLNNFDAKLDNIPRLPPPLVARTHIPASKNDDAFVIPELPARLAPPPVPATRSSLNTTRRTAKKPGDLGALEISDLLTPSAFDTSSTNQLEKTLINNTQPTKLSDTQMDNGSKSHSSSSKAHISSEPPAQWDNQAKQLVWKFDSLSPDKFPSGGSLLAKLDYRNYRGLLPEEFLTKGKPSSVDVKFVIPESSLSNVSVAIESAGYKLSLLKREIRSGRYKSEAYVT